MSVGMSGSFSVYDYALFYKTKLTYIKKILQPFFEILIFIFKNILL